MAVDDLNRWHREGFEAREAGKKLADCPYKWHGCVSPDYDMWIEGWWAAEESAVADGEQVPSKEG